MGNQTSSDGARASSQPLRNFLRPQNALGLSRAELDKRCQPSGLYPSCPWDDKAIRRLIGDGKLAARLKGTEHRVQKTDVECPICFLQYEHLNITKCCQANICTECYLQVRPQKDKAACCPFCNSPRLQVVVAQQMDEQAVEAREQEEQRVIEAKIRARANSVEKAPEITNDSVTSFGSSLEQNERVQLLRARSSSINSGGSDTAEAGIFGDIAAFAMTAEERRALEAEMRAQHSHPLARRLQQEQEERRLQNEREYYRTQAGRLRELRARRELLSRALGDSSSRRNRGRDPPLVMDPSARSRSGRDWNRIVNALETSGSGSIQSLDDLLVLEAAIMLSMEEEARRRAQGGRSSGDGEGHDNEVSEDSGSDAAQDGGTEFPLARSRIASIMENGGGAADLTAQMQSLMQSLQSLSSRRRGRDSSSNSALDTASLFVRGLSEEEQIAMAIAASLVEANSPGSGDDQSQRGDEETSESAPPVLGIDDAPAVSQESAPPSNVSSPAQVSTMGGEPVRVALLDDNHLATGATLQVSCVSTDPCQTDSIPTAAVVTPNDEVVNHPASTTE